MVDFRVKPSPHQLQVNMGPELGLSINLQYPNAVVIEPEHAFYHGVRVHKLHGETLELFKLVLKVEGLSADNLKEQGHGVIQTVGLIDMTLKLIEANHSIVWRFPESGLHPKAQLGLADVAIVISKKIADKYK